MAEPSELSELDAIRVAASDDKATPVMGVSMQVHLWFPGGHTREGRTRLLSAIRQYLDLVGDEITRFQKDGASRLTKLSGDNWETHYTSVIEKLDPEDEVFSPLMSGPATLSPFHTWGFARPPRKMNPETPSYFCASVPVSWLTENTDTFVKACTGWCETLGVAHGSGGLSPLFEVGMHRAYPDVSWPFLARFPGLDYFTSLDLCAGVHDGIRTMNWLTPISEHYLEKLGGSDALAKALPADCRVVPFKGGELIMAGSLPQLGDTSLADYAAPYPAVNAVLRDLRFEDYPNRPMCLIEVPDPLDPLETTLDWIKRFDDRV